MKIEAKTIPHNKQRYNTVGDYFEKYGKVHFRISKLENPWHEWLILIHEIIEYVLITKRGIEIKDIDKFDIEFKGEGEPGDHKDAPYYWEHQLATAIEHLIATELFANWQEYDERVREL